jgi:hypothetical protein
MKPCRVMIHLMFPQLQQQRYIPKVQLSRSDEIREDRCLTALEVEARCQCRPKAGPSLCCFPLFVSPSVSHSQQHMQMIPKAYGQAGRQAGTTTIAVDCLGGISTTIHPVVLWRMPRWSCLGFPLHSPRGASAVCFTFQSIVSMCYATGARPISVLFYRTCFVHAGRNWEPDSQRRPTRAQSRF